MKRRFFQSKYTIVVVICLFFVAGYFFGRSHKPDVVDNSIKTIQRKTAQSIASTLDFDTRKMVLLENPSLIGRIKEGASFGNENFSVSAAQNMFGRDEEAIDDIIDKTTIIKVANNVWTIRLPIVNCSVIETDEGLVLIDVGMTPAGPAILKSIQSISEKKIHTIIYTHGHVDHSYGTWALLEDGTIPHIIAHKNLPARFDRYLKLRGSMAKYMSQPLEQLPKDSADLIWPTKLFQDELEIQIGGITFFLKHFEGETNDQLFVWMPEQEIVFAADYYQGFLPNAGNGKRIQRNIGEWIKALRAMDNLHPKIMVPSHGDVIFDKKVVNEALNLHADALSYIHDYTVTALNNGLRKDQIVDKFVMPERFANHPLLKEQYVTAKDICKYGYSSIYRLVG